ncbi:hypothetical protein [Aeromonas sp. L_1B5_3]|uniref:hypothetical protein n=1 Tax=Aeromonas sp. L_1B5_3 TaxID=1588629 RepID=UPI0005B7130A|nr:hypothetical protein [Aeromonas sp. L_1B5_3]KIQ84679.1 hypothetical protein RW26_01365 [Aeromonas sp. L_1B5_3]
MAGSSSELRSVDHLWLTVKEIIGFNFTGIPKSESGLKLYLESASQVYSSSGIDLGGDLVRVKHGGAGRTLEYRVELLPDEIATDLKNRFDLKQAPFASGLWLTLSEIIELKLPSLPRSREALRVFLNELGEERPSLIKESSGQKRIVGMRLYRADLLPFRAQRALPVPSSIISSVDAADMLTAINFHSNWKLFSTSAEMAECGQFLLSFLNGLVASNGDFVRDDLSRALDLAEGLIRAGNSLSKTEGGAA